VRILIKVVFPAPLGSSSPKISPGATVRLTSFTATRSWNRRGNDRVSTMRSREMRPVVP